MHRRHKLISHGTALKIGPRGTVKDPRVNIACKCEKFTEADIIEACHRSLPVDNTQAIRRRTRAGMGHCQADPENYVCEQRVAAIIARETGSVPSDVSGLPRASFSFLFLSFGAEAFNRVPSLFCWKEGPSSLVSSR